jgi:uncharacterized SAM-binding protein YcdF (DUF218 family)/diadenosine tetraphosphate (Ap4A) HIT family hydrolase
MEIIDISNQKWNVDCIGCAIGAGEMTPPGGVIAENRTFYMHQDPEIPIAGFLIIAPRRHIHAILDLTADEYADFASLLHSGRKLLTRLPELRSVTVIQEEHSSHFHLWLFPWYDWMVEKYGKRSLSHIRPIMEYAKTFSNTPQQQRLILESVATLQNAAQNRPGMPMTTLEIPAHIMAEITEIVFGTPATLPPPPCDLIFVFGGSHPGLWQTAAQAYHQGLGNVILATGGHKPGVKHHYTWADGETPEAQVIRRELIKLGVPERAIVCEDRSTNTLENVLFAKNVFDFSTIASILVVCKNYGLGRQCRTLRQQMARRIQIFPYPFDAEAGSRGPLITRQTWMEYEKGRELVIAQLAKIIRYSQRGHLEPLENLSPELTEFLARNPFG